jgi:hypothetical protein
MLPANINEVLVELPLIYTYSTIGLTGLQSVGPRLNRKINLLRIPTIMIEIMQLVLKGIKNKSLCKTPGFLMELFSENWFKNSNATKNTFFCF